MTITRMESRMLAKTCFPSSLAGYLALAAPEQGSKRGHSLFVNPALNVLAAAFHDNNACLPQFFDVVGYRRRSDIQFFSQFTDAPPGIFDGGSPRAGGADIEEAQEDGESMRVRERFEHLGIPGHFACSIFRHISKYRSFTPCVKFFIIMTRAYARRGIRARPIMA